MHALGLPERGPFIAVSAQTPDAGAENLPNAARYLRQRGVASAWRLRADEQVGLIAVSKDRKAPLIRDMISAMASGAVGISPAYDDPLDTARALGTAALARRCLPPGRTGVASIDDDPVAAILAAAPDISARVVRRLLGRVIDLRDEDQEILLTTLRAWLDCGGNTSAAARILYCHRNTVRNRLRRLEDLTGQSLSDPRGAANLAIAAHGARLLGPGPGTSDISHHTAGQRLPGSIPG